MKLKALALLSALICLPGHLAAADMSLPWYREPAVHVILILAGVMIAALISYALHLNLKLEKQVAQRTRDLRETHDSLQKEHALMESNLRDKSFLVEIAATLNSTSSTYEEIVQIMGALNEKMGVNQLLIVTLEKEEATPLSAIIRITPWGLSDFTQECEKFPLGILEKLDDIEYFISSDTSELEYGEQNCFYTSGMRSLCIYPAYRLKSGMTGLFVFGSDNPQKWRRDETEMLLAISGMLVNAWASYREFHGRLAAEKKHTEAVKIAEKSSRMASIGVIAAGITHEINQPLNDIKLSADSVRIWNSQNKGLLPDNFCRWLDSISKNVNRITQIIDQMRSYWSLPDQTSFTLTNLNSAVRHAISLVDQQLKAHLITLKVEEAEESLEILGNKINVEQIVLNLVVNAMHALDTVEKDDKCIIIKISRDRDRAIVEVVDNGPGLPETDLQNLFDPFYSNRQPNQGMGLGLAIVKRFVEAMEGSVEANNNQSGGAHFYIVIPLSPKSVKLQA